MMISDVWEKLYRLRAVDLSKVEDPSNVGFFLGGDTYIFDDEVIVSTRDNHCAITVSPEEVPVSASRFYDVMALCKHLSNTHDCIPAGDCGVSFSSSNPEDDVAMITAWLLSPPKTGVTLFKNIIYDHVDLYIGRQLMVQPLSVFPHATNHDMSDLRWESWLGEMLFNGKQGMPLLSDKPVSTIDFPHASDVLSQDELDLLGSRDDCFVDSHGVHIVPSNGGSSVGVCQAIKRVTLIRAKDIPIQPHDTVSNYSEGNSTLCYASMMAHRKQHYDKFFSNTTSALDYQSLHNISRGVFR